MLTDKEKLKLEVKNHDIIIPLAAIVGAPACEIDQELAKSINQIQIENISKWISKNQMVLLPITNSGYGVGEKGTFCTEESPLNPISHYGKTKMAAEKAILRTIKKQFLGS